MVRAQTIRQYFRYVELLGVILTICLLPIDRFPYVHHIPLKLGFISFVLLAFSAAVRVCLIIYHKHRESLRRVSVAACLLLLPVIGYAQSIHYAIDKPLAKGATKLLLIAALKGLCFFVLLSENPSLWKTLKKTIYVITAVIVAFGFFQFVFDVLGASAKVTDLRSCCTSNSTYIFPRVHSAALEPLYFANFLLIPLWLMVHDFIFNKNLRRNKLLLSLFFAAGSLFLLSLARSALLGFIISAGFFAAGLHIKDYLRTAVPYILKAFGAIVIIALAFVILSGVASKHIHKSAINGSDSGVGGNISLFSSHAVSVADESAQTRYSTWPKALHYIKENPIRGVGAYNSRVRLNLNQFQKGVPDTQLQPFNNDLLGLLVDLGLIGIITFGPALVGLAISFMKSFRQHWATPSAPYALAVVAMLIQSNFFQSILLARLWVVVGIVLAGIYTTAPKLKEKL